MIDVEYETKIKQKYFQKYSKNICINNFENKNYLFDVILSEKNQNILVEYKSRYFKSYNKFPWRDDILIELIQSLPVFNKNFSLDNINNFFKAHNINIAIGWFYKCYCDRLIFFRYLDDKIYDIIDIDFRLFKSWFFNEIDNFKLQYSAKTTGTINAIVPIDSIPVPLIIITNAKNLTHLEQCE
jgi:hypothetical protein